MKQSFPTDPTEFPTEFIIHRAKRRSSGDYILLCHLPWNNVTPWVTWCSPDITGSHRMKGNYFYEGEEEAARQNFEER